MAEIEFLHVNKTCKIIVNVQNKSCTYMGKEAHGLMFRLQKAQRENGISNDDYDYMLIRYLIKSPLWEKL